MITQSNPEVTGYLHLPRDIYHRSKAQTYAPYEDGIIVARGGLYSGGAITPYNFYGASILNHDGTYRDSFTGNPQMVMDLMEPHIGIVPTRIETEGSAVSRLSGETKLYSLVVTNSSSNTGADTNGMHLVEINVDPNLATSIDLKTAYDNAGVKSATDNLNTVHQNKPYNYVTNEIMTSWSEILDYMKSELIREYQYYETFTGDTVDINGVDVIGTCIVNIRTGNFSTFFVTVQGADTLYNARIAGNPYVQKTDDFVMSPDSTLRPEFYGQRTTFGQYSEPSINFRSNKTTNMTAVRFFAGTSSSPTLVGNIGFDINGTRYTETSDPRMKTPFKPHLTAWEDFNKIYDALGVFEFKHALGKEVLGFNAHKIIDADVGAGQEGQGSRTAEIGSKYGEKEVGGETIDLLVEPAGVDNSRLVPYLVSVIHDLNQRLKKLES